LIIWDIYATRSGPIKKIIDIIDEDEEEKRKKRRLEAQQAAQAAQQALQTGGPGTNVPLTTKTPPVPPQAVPGPSQPPIPAQHPVQTPPQPQVVPVKTAPSQQSDLDALQLFGLYDTDKFSIGLGDLIFYSVFTAMAMKYFLLWLPFYGFYTGLLGIVISLYVAVFIGIAVLVGFLKTVQLLEKNYVLPGLPISMGIALVCFITFLIILEALNLFFYGNLVPIF
jgi:hypothetical protein